MILDGRTKNEICEQIKTLASVYTPEWNFTLENPDTGSVLASIFAEQLEAVIQEYNRLPSRYEEELIRMLGIVPKKPEPARTVIVLQPSAGMPEGIHIPEGSRFYAQRDGRDTPVVFESSHDLYMTDAKITAAFAISEGKRTVIPLCGEEGDIQYPLSLFDFRRYIPYTDELRLVHPWLFRGELSEFSLCLGSEAAAARLTDENEFAFSFLTEKGKVPVNKKKQNGESIDICQGADSDTLIIERRTAGEDELFLSPVYFTAGQQSGPPAYLYDGSQEIQGNSAAVFGEEISLYKECYIGFDEGLVQEGNGITLEFELEFKEREVRSFPPGETELKLIKKRPNPLLEERMADTYIQEVSFSYYNGRGFRRLPVRGRVSDIFSAPGNAGRRSIEFVCPDDWAVMEQEGCKGYMIRLQIVKADYCYHLPGRHHYPYLTHITAVYSHREKELWPVQAVRVQGKKETDLTGYIQKRKPFPAFLKFPYKGESMLFGFDRRPACGPASLYLIIRKNINFSGMQATFEYSSPKGFRPLKVLNNTEDFKNSGIVLFVPPSDMSEAEIEGETRYWLRLTLMKPAGVKTVHPVAEHIYMNGVEVRNIERGGPKEQYVERVAPDMSFPAPASQLLDVDIVSRERGRKIRWTETDSFDRSGPKDRHYMVDRKSQTVRFGDGRSTKIPKNTDGPAFTMEIHSCDGEEGNVPENTIDRAAFSFPNIEQIFNPLAASGGSDLEGDDSVRRRGRVLIGTGARLVSPQDFVNAAKAYSNMVANVWCRAEGRRITLAVLMQDYKAGPRSFRQIKDGLECYLLEKAPVSMRKQDLVIREPLFVKVSVELWIQVEEWKTALEVRSRILDRLGRLFAPVKHGGRTEPRAGYMPAEAQILMSVRSFAPSARIQQYNITVSYVDENGRHTTELGRLKRMPFMVCVNGTHEVHV